MTDWLKLLWEETEAGQEFDLLREPDPRPVGSGNLNRSAEGNASETERTAEGNVLWQDPRSVPAGVNGPARPALAVGEFLTGRPVLGGIRRSADGSAVEMLYRRVRETASPGQLRTPRRTVVVREEIPAAPGLTEERLDRSLRRDSRRYDSGMSIY